MKMIVDARQHCLSDYAELAAQLDHDVRSPLTAICTYAECLEQAPEGDGREGYARAIKGEARRLGRLCADFVTLAAPQPEERLREVDVHKAARLALDDLKELCELLKVTAEVIPFAGPVLILWPPTAVHHLLAATFESILMSVAPGSHIVVEAQFETRDVALMVTPMGERPFLCNPHRLSLRAAARIVGTRGGSLMLLDGEEPQVRLNLPFSGRLTEALPVAPLERSA